MPWWIRASKSVVNNMKALGKSLKTLWKYPSAVMGLVVILALVGIAIYAMVTIPYQEAIRLWRGGEEIWYQNPKFAPPAWINLFSATKYAESFAVNTTDGSLPQQVTLSDQDTSTIAANYTFSFQPILCRRT